MTEAEGSNPLLSTPATTPRNEKSEENRKPSLAEIEYKSLNAYFERILKHTLWAIGIVVAVAGALLWKSSSDAKSSIDATRIEASREIENVGKQSSEIARTEARQRIDEAFEKGNIQQMIDRVARERVDVAVDREIEKNLGAKIRTFQAEMADMGDVSAASSRLRLGFREGLDSLVKQSNSSDETVRRYARASLLIIGSDYETVLKRHFPNLDATQVAAIYFGPQPPPKTLKDFFQAVRHSDNMDTVVAAFVLMREKTGTKFQMFDIPAVEKWCADNKPKCE
jgi:hypothetical protein